MSPMNRFSRCCRRLAARVSRSDGISVAWPEFSIRLTTCAWPCSGWQPDDAGVMIESNLELAVIGNGRTAALVEPSGRIVWWCLPRYDGDPVFCRLLAGNEEKGFTDVVLDRQVENRSEYLRNTAMVVTELTDGDGGAVRITDF